MNRESADSGYIDQLCKVCQIIAGRIARLQIFWLARNGAGNWLHGLGKTGTIWSQRPASTLPFRPRPVFMSTYPRYCSFH